MKKLILISGALTLLLTGCNAAKFAASKGGESSASSSSFGTMSSVDPKISKVCENELKNRGLQYGSGYWRKKINLPCGYAGIGYIEIEVEIDAAVNKTCEDLAELDERLQGNDRVEYEDSVKIPEQFARNGDIIPHTYTPAPQDPGFKWQERQRRCAQNSRCGSRTPAESLGRFAWLKKCEATVPEFKAFLDGLRRVEDCSGGTQQQQVGREQNGALSRAGVCIFANGGTPFFPLVILNNGHADNAPAPSLTSANTLARIDDLAALAAQVTEACPNPAQVAPIDTICTSGCYSSSQRLLTSAEGKYEAILAAKESNTSTLAVLTRSSTLEAPRFANVKVGRYVASKDDAKETLLTFATQSGASLTVTTNHPLVDGSGVMREASTFKAGEALVKSDGVRDPIVAITKSEIFGKVYNVAPVSIAPEDNLIVSEGLINGSHNYQTVLRSELNRQVLRSNLAKGF